MIPRATAAQPGDGCSMPVDPSEDELARHWSLTPADLAVIAECRGARSSSPLRPAALRACASTAAFSMTTGTRRSRSSTICPASSACRRCCFLTGLAVLRRNGSSRCASAAISASATSTDRLRPICGEWLRPGAIEGRTAAELLRRAERQAARVAGHAAGHRARSSGWSPPR